jgi:RNA binding exosome subunit
VVQREVQSVEVSCLIQSTEDEERIKERVRRYLGIAQSPEEEALEGHFGNRILHVRWHLTGDEAWNAFQALLSLLGYGGVGELLGSLTAHLDEHRALYVRLNKQALMNGIGAISDTDPVRIRVKPRSFMIRGSPESFYQRLMERRT